MLDLSSTPDEFLEPIARVLEAAVTAAPGLQPQDVMVIGAAARDLLHHALGHSFQTSATHDLDLALALTSWDAYRQLAAAFPKVGNTGIRFRIAQVTVDLLPFGEVEDPSGITRPPTRAEPFSVWALEEIFAASLPLALPSGATVRIPTVPGFAAAKIGAWLDRSEWREIKDARDLAVAAFWYEDAAEVSDRLYDSEQGNAVLIAEDTDLLRAAAHLLGLDVVATIGELRAEELRARWPGNIDLLVDAFVVRGRASAAEGRRRAVIAALTAGLTSSTYET